MPYQIQLPDGSAVLIADNVPRSKALELAKQNYPDAFPAAPGIGSQLLNVPKEFVKGAASGVVQAVGGLGALPYAGARYLAPSLKPFAETGFGQAITSAEQYLAPSDEGAITQVAGGLGSLASILGPQVALRGLGAAGRFAGMAPGAARPVGVAQVTGLGAEEARQRVEVARGDDINVTPGQELGALTVGAGIGLTELLPVERLLRGVDKAFAPTVANYLKRAATQFGVEGAQEAAAGILQDLNARGIYNPNMPIGDSALGDALLGGSVGAIAQSGLDFLVRKDIAKAYQARINQEKQQELDTRLEAMRQERDAQIAQTTKNLGVPDPKVLMLPAPAPQVEAPRETDPLMNPVGFFNSDELSLGYIQAINKLRKKDGKKGLSQYSIEDFADAGAPQQEIDRLLTYKTGYDGKTPFAAEDVLNIAAKRNVSTTTSGFKDFLRRATGTEDLDGMSQPQLFSAFKALDALPPSETTRILPPGTNATRFTKDQYERSVRNIKTLFPKSNMLSREKAIKEIKAYSNLENDRDAESLLQTAIRNGDFGTTSRTVYEVVIPEDSDAPAVRRYTTRDAAERAAASLGLNVRESIHQEVSLPSAPGELPGGPDIRKGTFKQGEAPASFEIRSPDAVLTTAATQEEADAKAESLQQRRAQKANVALGMIAQNEAKIAKSQRKLESMEADGKAETLQYKKMAAGIAAQNKRLQDEINALKAKAQSYVAPLEIAPKGQKPVTREGFTLFEEGNPVATFPDQQAAEEAALMRLPDETLQTIVNLAPSQKGLMPKRLGKMAKAELDRRTDQQPPGFGVSIRGDKAAAEERLAQLGIFTPEFQKAAEELTKKLRPMMDRLGLKDMRLNILKAIKNAQGQSADGYYAQRLIAIALDAENPMRTLRHEGIHALKELGAFTPQQWKVLENKARSEWVKKYDIRNRYKQMRLSEPEIIEEAIADAFSDFDQTKPPAGLLGSLFRKIKQFFEAFGNALDGSGFQTADSVFQRTEEGGLKVGSAAIEAAPARGDSADDRRFALKTKGKPKEDASKVVFEIAPDPDNAEIAARWDSLNNEEKKAISERVAQQAVTRAMKDLDYTGYLRPQVGSYMDATNPSFAILLEDGNPVELAKQLGFILRQREMVAIATEPVAGAEIRPSVIVSLGDKTPEEVDAIYQSLRQLEVNGKQIVGGQSYIDGKMVILNYSDVPNAEYLALIDAKLGGQYEVAAADVYAAYPGKAEYDYSKGKDDPRGVAGVVRQRSRAVRDYASKLLEDELRQAGQGRAQVSDPAINIVNRSVAPPDFGKKPTVEDVGNYFDVLIRDEFGGPLDFNNPEHFDRAVRLAAEELRFQRERENSGFDWYEEDIAEAFKVTAELIPALNNTQKRQLFNMMAGIMSTQTVADKNWVIAAEAFEHYLDTGIIPGINPQNGRLWMGGLTSGTKRDQLNMLNAMVRGMGEQAAVEWLYSEHPVSEINEFRSRYGGFVSGVSGKQNDKKVGYEAFGPKIGPFVSNLNGIHEETVDRWMIRTFNRYFGTMIGPDGKIMDAPSNESQRRATKELLRRVAQELNIRSYQAQSMLWFFEQNLFREIGTPAPSYGYSDGARQFRDERDARDLQAGRGISSSPASKFSLRRDGGRRDQGGAVAPLEGAPVVQGATGPDPRLVEAAQEYARRAGIPFRTQATYVDVDEDFAKRVAQAFDDMPHDPTDPEVREAYESMISQLRDQYDVLADAGYTFTFFDSDSDPYDGNPWNAMRDLRQNKTMAVYGTYAGYGTEGITDAQIEDNPMLADTGLRWKDQKGKSRMVTANDLFRAVHDAFGHGLEGSGFRARGEENAYQAHVRLFTGPAIKAVTTETRGQNSWLNYGPYGETNRNAKVLDTVFAENKIGVMDPWTWESNIVPDEPAPRYALRRTDTPEFRRWFGDSKVVDADGQPLVMYHGTARDITEFQAKQANAIFLTDDPTFAEGFSEMSRDYMVDEAIRNLDSKDVKEIAKEVRKKIVANYGSASSGYGKRVNDALKEWVSGEGKLEGELLDYAREMIEARLASGPNIMPLYVRAEKPFDYENDADIEELTKSPSGENLYPEELDVIRMGRWDIIEKPHVQRAIKEAGFDAFYVMEAERKNLAVYNKDQVKSAIGNVGAYGQRPVTQEEADRAGMTVEEATAAQARGDIRFALSMKDLSPDSSLVPDEGGNPDGTLGTMPDKFGNKPIRMLIGYHDDIEDKGYGANHILLRVLEDRERIPGGAEELLEKIVRTAQRTAQNYRAVYKDGNKLVLHDGRNNLILSQRPEGMSVVTMFVMDNPRAKYGAPVWTGKASNVAQFVQPLRGLSVEAQEGRVGIKRPPVQTKRVFTPSQITASAVETPAVQTPGTLSVKKGGFKFSLRETLGDDMVESIERTTTAREEKGFAGKIADALSPTGFAKFRQGMINRYEGIESLSKKAAAEFGDKELLADTSAIAAALFADRAAGVAAESFKSGIPVYKNGFTAVSDMDGAVKGLIPILEPLMELNDPFAFQAFQFYAGTRRGRRLTAEGREKLFTPEDIQKGKLLEQNYPMFREVFDEYQKYNEGLVKFMRDTGVISDQEAKVWTQNWDYIPFYRQLEGDDTAGPKVFSSIAGVAKPKKLKGGDAPLADFLETVVRNSRAAIEAGMKNVAAQRVARDMLRLNQGELVPAAAAKGPDIMTVKENGLTKHYRVHDPLLFESLKGLNLPQLPFLEVLAAPSNLLRNLVTKDPGFMLANLIRDSLQAWVTTGTNMTPVVDTFKQYGAALAGMSPEAKQLAKAGLFAGYDFGSDVKSSAREVERELRMRSGQRTMKDIALWPLSKTWAALEKASSASDVATRAEVYKRTLERTGNEAEALYQAMEVLNFSRKGNSALIRVLTALIPFMNARIQGLDVLYRSGFGESATQNRERMQKAFITRSLSILAMSAMYWALASDTEEYKTAEQEVRDNYWIVGSVRIPIPFEIGTLFKVFPERILEYFFGQDTGKDLKDSIVRNITSTLSINLIPQAFLPVVENVANYSFFTGQPIVGKGMEDVAAKYQVTPGTSILAQQVGDTLNVSPMKVDNLIRGYTGTLGTYAALMLDSVMRGEGDPTKAAMRLEQMPFFKRFYASPESTGTVTAYYELKRAVDESTRTINFLERTNSGQELAEYLKGKGGRMLSIKPYIESLNTQMGELRDLRRTIQMSQIDPERKRDVLDAIRKSEVALTSQMQRIKQVVY